MHISTDDASMKKIGVLPSGGDCIINKMAAEADLPEIWKLPMKKAAILSALLQA